LILVRRQPKWYRKEDRVTTLLYFNLLIFFQ
jgi:hypothetical protein